ncbi:MAG TPA: glycosyltransferase family 4 protein [Thermodesulfobacteriota bacterium]|nr:glycosyltransferase family 4 protein [Thermodesulfobacteriota bacterium]
MRVAQVAPLYESVPPKFYGGTERVVSNLTDELVNQGHDVTLFASGDSVTKAKLISPVKNSLRLDESCVDPLAHHFFMTEMVLKEVHNFDLIHFHVDYLHFPVSRRENLTHLTTLHGRLDIPDLFPLFNEYAEMPLVSISNSQRKPLPNVNWVGTVYHGLPPDLYSLQENPGTYLAFLGRISPEKRLDRAIDIAKGAGIPIKIAAKVDKADREYYESIIKPILNHPLVEFLGEITEDEKNDFLGNALALLFPIDWPEPFGLVMIEAMACGTPVIAYSEGSVPEIVEDGVTGYVIKSIEEGEKAVEKVSSLSRKGIRQVFEGRFTTHQMVSNYVEIYEKLIETALDEVA